MSDEPILQENKDRFVIFPIKHHDIWDYYKKAEASFWTAEELDLSEDVEQYSRLTITEMTNLEKIKRIIKNETRK